MSKLTPLSYREEANPVLVDRPPFPYSTPQQPAAMQEAAAQPQVGMDRMKQLEQMLQEAQGRAEIVEKEAYDKAYLAGEKAGMALGQKRAEQLLESVGHILQESEKAAQEIKLQFAEAAMDIATHLARSIIGDTLEHDQERLWNVAKQSALQLPDASGLQLAVSPDDFATFKRLLEDSELMATLISDESLAPATCRIISTQQDILIDPIAAIDTFMEQLRPALLEKQVVEEPSATSRAAESTVASSSEDQQPDTESVDTESGTSDGSAT